MGMRLKAVLPRRSRHTVQVCLRAPQSVRPWSTNPSTLSRRNLV